MSLLNALRGMIHSRTGAWKGLRRRGLGRQPWRLALEVLEDRACLSGNLLVSSFWSDSVLAYDGTQGTFLQTFTSGGILSKPVGLALGANGDLYVSGRDTNDVLHYDGNTGSFLSTFVAPGSGGLNGPHDLTFGPDHNLYVNSGFSDSVVRYDGGTGAPLPASGQVGAAFVPSGSGGLGFPHGLTFGPDGNVYIGDRNNNSVPRYSGTTGAFLGNFVSPGSGGLNVATGLTFGPDGNLYVDSFNTNSVLRYDGKTGTFLGTFASGGGLNGPQGLAFGPDGNLYVSSFNTNSILRYNGRTGAFLNDFASGGGLVGPTYLVFRQTHSTTTLIPSANPSVFGQPDTFTATVSSVTGTAGVPTGTITFTVDGTAQTPVPLSNGQATFSTSALGVGGHSISATYNGDPGFQTSTSANLSQAVNQAGTTTAVSASTAPSVFGQPVKFTATVSAIAPGAGMPTGTVTFTIDGTAQAPVSLSNGRAALTTSALAAGSHMIVVAYNGDGNFNTSISALNETVNKADTATMVSASADPSVFGQPVTFTAVVAALAPGAGTPTGTVTYTIDGTAQSPLSLSNGQASFTTSALSVGSHVVTAAYSGDGNFNTSTSAGFSQTVNKADAATTVGASAGPSLFGQLVTFTATVNAVVPGAGLPTGTVTFAVDGVVQSSAALSNGQATFTTSALSVGGHAITATYNGDGNFNASASAGLSQAVNQANTTITFSSSVDPSVFGEPVTFTGIVAAQAPGAGTPTGTVTFSVDGTAQAPVALSNGQAAFTTSTLSVGSHKIALDYSGDGNFNISTLDPIQTVRKASTSLAVSASAQPSVFGQPVTFTTTVSVVAPGAGMPTGTVTFTIDGIAQTPILLSNEQAAFTTAALGVGSHVVTAVYSGDGNFNSSTSAALNQTVNRADATTSVGASADPSVFGQPVTFTAAVSAVAPGAGLPTGTVTFSVDGTAQTSVPLTNGQAAFSSATLGVGSHMIVASYNGDGNFNTSISALNQTVNKADTATTVSSSAEPSLFGQPVTFTAVVAAVAPGAGTLSGTVTFTIDGSAQTPVVLNNGQAAFTSALGTGSHVVTAAYSGDGSFNSSTSAALNQTVNQAQTATTVSASGNPVVFGQPVTFTAAVSAVAPGMGLPTGTVTVTIDGVAQPSVVLSNGQAAFTTSTLSVGSHSITVTYSGDTNFAASTSASLSQAVNRADTAITFGASVDPSVFGQPVTFTGTVVAVAPGAGTPTGTVTFTIDGTAQTPVALSNGQAAFATAALGTGSHVVTAAYSGDGSFNSSTSAALNQTVNQAQTATTVSASGNPVVFGQPVTFTAAVSAVAPGAGLPTGTVTITIDGVAQPSVVLSNGQAAFTTSTLSVGSHSIAVTYSGDGNFAASTSASLSQAVNRADTAITFGASVDPSVFGQPVTFTGTVVAVAPGAGMSTGTVTFLVDGVAQTPVALSNGQAAFTTSTLSVGSHEIALDYSGDGNFNASTLDPIQTVRKASTSLAVSASAQPSVFGQPVTFTTTVSVVAPGAGMPTGTVTFTIDGIAQTPAALSNGQATLTTATLGTGGHVVTVAYSGDGNFNSSTSAALNQTVNQAQTATNVSASADPSVFGQPVTFTAAVNAVVPGVGLPTGTVSFTIDGVAQPSVAVSNNGQATFTTSTLGVGGHVVAVIYSGDGNFTSSTSAALNQTVNQAQTATTVSASGNPVVFGQPITITATVAAMAPGAGLPAGTVTFTIDGAAQPSVVLSNGQAAFTTSTLSVGSHTIAAAYSGDGSFNASASSLNQVVNQGDTTTAVSTSMQPSVFGQPVTFTAVVAVLPASAGTPSGTVTFSIDGSAQTPVPLNNGQASFTTAGLGVGGRLIVATYNGDGNFNTSTSALSQTVNKAATAIDVSASPDPSVFGQPVTFTATVAAVVPGTGTPTGTVTFAIDGVAQPSATLSNGQATFTTSALGVGAHEISVSYNGDGNFNTSLLDPTQTVIKAGTMTAVSASASASGLGQPVTFTANVSVMAPGAGTPNGTVTFTIDGAAQTPVALSNGQATWTTSALSAGSHTITAVYNGDSSFSTSTSAAFNETVRNSDTTTGIQSSTGAPVFGQPVTFTATVAAVAQGAGTPTGAVLFTIDGMAQTRVLLSNGQATFTTSALSVGNHTVTATYRGDSNFASSTSAALNQTVSQASTSTTIRSSADPASFRQLVVFTADVAAVAPGAGTPTGTVTFTVDGVLRATVALVNGTATFSTSALAKGSHVVIATYHGDTDFASSDSPALTQTVNRHHCTTDRDGKEDRDDDCTNNDHHRRNRYRDRFFCQYAHA